MLQVSMVLMTRITEEVIYSLIYPFFDDLIDAYEIRSHLESHTIQKAVVNLILESYTMDF